MHLHTIRVQRCFDLPPIVIDIVCLKHQRRASQPVCHCFALKLTQAVVLVALDEPQWLFGRSTFYVLFLDRADTANTVVCHSLLHTIDISNEERGVLRLGLGKLVSPCF